MGLETALRSALASGHQLDYDIVDQMAVEFAQDIMDDARDQAQADVEEDSQRDALRGALLQVAPIPKIGHGEDYQAGEDPYIVEQYPDMRAFGDLSQPSSSEAGGEAWDFGHGGFSSTANLSRAMIRFGSLESRPVK